ncbi:hypothetical protein A0H81_14762 [Grifola frondosa]|uniref:BTB domain-containing protein n=1 Tax=Grifola frondosa TaxID=5627 RepID=A0A1C7LMU7_GRIFR|nr:hypothetical protein A0H81_14762 [Grifola frondosa]
MEAPWISLPSSCPRLDWEMEVPPLYRDAKVPKLTTTDFWFSDGNIVLVVGHVGFKVHRGQLERHSDVFQTLFSIPQPKDQETIDGCSWVELYDSPSDVLHLLRALYDGLYFQKPAASDFPVIASVLRLSTKYLIEHLRQCCLVRLERDWPSTLLGWDQREKLASDDGRYNPRDCFAHPVLVIQLAQELHIDTVLPSAFYDLSRYGPRKIVSGVISPPPAPLPNVDSAPSGDALIVRLNQQDLSATFLGRESGQRYLASFIENELTGRPLSANCANKHDEGGRDCLESFYFIMLNVLRSVGGIATGRDADPLFTLVQAVEMLSRTDFSDGVRQCGLKMCPSCKADFTKSVSKAREQVWEQIPGWFGLRGISQSLEG